jgi:catechol 2,3-dioxygenase-like lactoylglutathione lyase family enzyme
MSSVCGVSASPGNGAYSASKFAVEAWSDSLRLELLPFNLHVIKVRPGQIRTQIQSEWFDSYTKNYEAAPGQIRQLYGADKFSDKVADAATKMSDTEMSHPSLVVRSLQDILALQEEAKIEPYYWIGSDAHTFWRALHILPTPVADTIKSAMVHFLPERQDLPPTGVISHVTIRVRSIQASVPFYEAFGFVTFGPNENCQQFLQSGASKKYWSPMVLLLEDPRMEARGKSSDAGMTRLSLLTTDLKRDMLKLASKGIQPMGPMSEIGIIRLAAFHDPDNFVVYIVEFKGIVGAYIGATLWWGGKMAPSMFSWTVNCISVKHCMSLFEKLGFKTFSDQNTDQVAYSLLPAFNIDPKTTLIEHVRMCKLPDASVFATLMEWTTPKSERTGGELMNTMTITVSDVHAALDKARMVGMSVPEDGAITYRRVPVYGEVLVGTAYLEDACNRIDFCSFANRRA